MKNFPRLIALILSVLLFATLAGCNFPGRVTPTPRIRYITWTPKPTDTPAPTNTPAPTETFTPEPSPTLSLPPSPTIPVLPTEVPTVDPKNAIRVYYINKDEVGQFGCNEELWYLTTKQAVSGNLADDIRYALSVMLSYHQPQIGTLYHGGYASNLAVSSVDIGSDGRVTVALTGEYVPTEDRCDGKRFIDQIRQTIKQFGNIPLLQITINGTPIADVIARNK